MRWRLFIAFAIIIAITLTVFGFLARQNTIEAVDSFAQRGGFIGADRLVESLEEYYTEHHSWTGVSEVFNSSGSGGNSQGKGGGKGMMGTGGNPGGMMTLVLTDTSGMPMYSTSDTYLSQKIPENELEYAIPIHEGDEVVGYLVAPNNPDYVNTIQNTNFSEHLNDALLPTVLITSGLGLVLAFVTGYLILRPVRHLTHASEKLAQGDYSQRVPTKGKDEMARLGKTFNYMAESIQQAEENRRALTADIAHELRTPLAVQRANLEALQDGVYPLSMETLEPILEQNKHLTRMVEDLRTLAQADARALALEKVPVDLSRLVEQGVENFKPQARQQNIEMDLIIASPIPNIEADARRITQILNNLLVNGLQHTPEGGKIEVRLDQEAAYAALKVRDTGEGIPEEALPRIFDRFYRADRSRARVKGGSGLGLTIARQLAEAHGGTLTAENHHEKGAVFTLRLPL